MNGINIFPDKNSVLNNISASHWIDAIHKTTLDKIIRNGKHGIWTDIKILKDFLCDFHICSSLDLENNIIITGFVYPVKTNSENINYTDTSILLGKAYIDIDIEPNQYDLCINILKQHNNNQFIILDENNTYSIFKLTHEFVGNFNSKRNAKQHIKNMREQNQNTILDS